jgi:hypothetical protein
MGRTEEVLEIRKPLRMLLQLFKHEIIRTPPTDKQIKCDISMQCVLFNYVQERCANSCYHMYEFENMLSERS